MDKRKTQISLALNLPEKEFKEQVKQHWNITFARQGKISVVAKRMIALILTQIQENANQLKPYFELHATDVIVGSDSGKAYKEIKQAFQDLASAVWIIEDIKSKKFEPRNLLDTTKTEKRDGFKTAYDNGRITIALNPALEDYFIALSQYSKYELKNYMTFQSWYSMRFWEILSAYKDTGKWYVPLQEYRKLMDCEKKYKSPNRLIEMTTAEPLEELKGSDLEFTFEKVFDRFSGRGRPALIGINFILVNAKKTPEMKLEEWKKVSPEREMIINDLTKRWKIPAVVLVKHLPTLKIDGAKRLIKSFEEKERSNRKIDSKEKFCTKAMKMMSDQIKGI